MAGLFYPLFYSFALINLAFVTFLPGEFITHLEESKGLLVHIGLALFSYATLIIAALYALQLAWLDYQLKNKRLSFTADMPPLMTIERKLFHITQVGGDFANPDVVHWPALYGQFVQPRKHRQGGFVDSRMVCLYRFTVGALS
ncbi:Inner membrane protein ypjD [Ewingella americana]|uniref:Inner membrane protein ypjD n=1 Tax=Ewingella americana TaxID=41202 RepID=A0A377NJ68_9GAMM|nr:Inner membrane protein ypjD [Ewingella americana]